ncbi:hypothetical protein EMIHUDRAFT_237905 [Emiliania huxleyi CCMP1516]|uniref:Uncharacterized protein n=2 Tax=Emiliania huxleyi TaxID=2903 RepID=A0A0D3JP40_EMIH1|nr:hypothetical protein EMIHUDRAFT_237905 [Emiliania huxleyi CCMP1516]EOD25275.1 hypothetical protein EMIHUDRAFT_237905 [Emiliania huxleyi CCMP1516]|eukprot:XP_005777704.1 hypothetical protein EMIHUDRAFT_237905 [Emiliania huxleyi CCMP1516]
MPLCCAADSPSSEPARGGEPRPVSLAYAAPPKPYCRSSAWRLGRAAVVVADGGAYWRVHLTPFLLNGYPCLLCPCVVCFKFLQPKVIEGKKIDCALADPHLPRLLGGAPQLFTTKLVWIAMMRKVAQPESFLPEGMPVSVEEHVYVDRLAKQIRFVPLRPDGTESESEEAPASLEYFSRNRRTGERLESVSAAALHADFEMSRTIQLARELEAADAEEEEADLAGGAWS